MLSYVRRLLVNYLQHHVLKAPSNIRLMLADMVRFQSREIERGSRGSAVDLAWESRVFGVGSHPKHRHGRV